MNRRLATLALLALMACDEPRRRREDEPPLPPPPPTRIDLLLVVDNSRGMADKQAILAASVPDLLHQVMDAGLAAVEGGAVPTIDMHVGVVTSSLGGLGADTCTSSPEEDDRGHLVSRILESDGAVPTYEDKGFLVWDPLQTHTPPGQADPTQRVVDMVRGAGETGCGYESPLESMYRFLIEPDPYDSIVIENNAAKLEGTDMTLLAQRADFLRPDSLLVVIVVSDENDCSTMAGSLHYKSRQLYTAESTPWRMPRARAACATNPSSDCCRSCGQAPGPGCDESADDCDASLPAEEDNINLRCSEQKRRFGIDFLYPLTRYVDGLSAPQVGDRHGDVVANPIFANGRSPDSVLLAVIAGAPWQSLVRGGEPAEGAYVASELDAASWQALVGNPMSYVPPLDSHMVESAAPRPGLPGPGGANVDPIHGREHADADELQYACTFSLPDARDCTAAAICACGDPDNDLPICDGTTQIGAAATPGIRQLELAHILGGRAVAASICPATLDTTSPGYGYRPAFATLADLVATRLGR
jgi:hypothetical protein